MRFDEVKVIVGDKIYRNSGVNWEQSLGEYPRMEVDAYIGPQYCVGDLKSLNTLTIKNVIFNPPATIVFWSDNTKTVVKCDRSLELYDPEKGLAMAIAKKMIGDNKSKYYNTFKYWLDKYNEQKTKDLKALGMKKEEANTSYMKVISKDCDEEMLKFLYELFGYF